MVGGHPWDAAEENKEEDSMRNDEIENAVRDEIARQAIVDVPMKAQRSLATVTAEIRSYQDAAKRMALQFSVEIGRRLVEAKSMVSHGEWGSYLKEELGFSQSTANNHMRLFEAYGAQQMTLGGAAVNSQALADLSYTQALALLALPSEGEREVFVETHDLGSMSTRELREELRKRQQAQDGDDEGALLAEQFGTGAASQEDNDEAEAEAEMLRAKLDEAQKDRLEAISQMDQAQMQGEEYRRRALKAEQERQVTTKGKEALRAKSEEAERAAEAAAERAAQAEKKAQEAADRMSSLQAELDKARKAEDKAKRELEKVKANKTAQPEVLEKLRKEAEAAAEARHKADSEELKAAKAQCVKAEADVDAARQEAARARQEAERLEKELRMAGPKVAVFRDRFASLQGDLSALIVSIDELPADKQAGARKGLRAILQNALNMVQEPEEET